MEKNIVIERIKSIRRQKGISQESIAYDLGIDYSTYGKIERGHIALTVERLEKISQILKVSLGELYGWTDQASANINSEAIAKVTLNQYVTELESTKRELELLQQQLRDKEKIISLLENTRRSDN